MAIAKGFNGFGMPLEVFDFLNDLGKEDRAAFKHWLETHKEIDIQIAMLEAIDPTVTIDVPSGGSI